MKRIHGRYEVEDLPDQNGKWGGYKVQCLDAKGEYGFIANTNIPIKPDANKKLDSEDLEI